MVDPENVWATKLQQKSLLLHLLIECGGAKETTLQEFNEKVFNLIQSCIDANTECNLSGTVFEGDINFYSFNKNNPMPKIHFHEATFHGKTDFFGVHFDEDASFNKATFKNIVTFSMSDFTSHALFDSATFEGKALFEGTQFLNNVNFHGVTFEKSVKYSGIIFEGLVQFKNTIFNGDAIFRGLLFNKTVFFNESVFSNDVRFHGRIKNEEEGLFGDLADFTNIIIRKSILFEKANLSKISFLNTDGRRIDFVNCYWGNNDQPYVLYDEQKPISPSFSENRKDRLRRVETLYRQFKQKAKESHDEGEASLWHYREKLMRMKRLKWKDPVLFFYWLTSGFAERPFRSFVSLIVLILLFALSFFLIEENFSEPGFATALTDTILYASFTKLTAVKLSSNGARLLVVATKIILPLQAALLALAIRNRYRR